MDQRGQDVDRYERDQHPYHGRVQFAEGMAYRRSFLDKPRQRHDAIQADRPPAGRLEQPAGQGRRQDEEIQQPVNKLGAEALPSRQVTLRSDGVRDPPWIAMRTTITQWNPFAISP